MKILGKRAPYPQGRRFPDSSLRNRPAIIQSNTIFRIFESRNQHLPSSLKHGKVFLFALYL